ncbi:MAG: hypothetical protein Q7S53_03610 [bacterium]|nr:hypothetical protein [bacterium]
MTAKDKKAVEDDLMLAIYRKETEIRNRILAGTIDLKEVDKGYQAILDREFELTWDKADSPQYEQQLAYEVDLIIQKMISELAGEGKIVDLMKKDGNRLVVASQGLSIMYPHAIDALPYDFQREAAIRRFKPSLRRVRKILRKIREEKALTERLSSV